MFDLVPEHTDWNVPDFRLFPGKSVTQDAWDCAVSMCKRASDLWVAHLTKYRVTLEAAVPPWHVHKENLFSGQAKIVVEALLDSLSLIHI